MWRLVCLLTAAMVAGGAERISQIEFFGAKGIDVDRIRRELPVHEGDLISTESRERVREAISRSIGKAPTDVQIICCDDDGNSLLFIGLPGNSSKQMIYLPEPHGKARLPASLMDLYERADKALEAAVRRGGEAASEDDSQGYALIKEPAARLLQLEIRDWAVKHQREIVQVLSSSSDVNHRRVAADALGYSHQTPDQLVGLAKAARDPDEEVRNNATRGLGVLCWAKPELARQVPAAVFIQMLSSGVWTDRNKTAALLAELTAGRDPALLGAIRDQALDSVIEMASWRRAVHAAFSRILLGRIAGLPEERVSDLAWNGPVIELIDAANGRKAATPSSR